MKRSSGERSGGRKGHKVKKCGGAGEQRSDVRRKPAEEAAGGPEEGGGEAAEDAADDAAEEAAEDAAEDAADNAADDAADEVAEEAEEEIPLGNNKCPAGGRRKKWEKTVK